MISFNSSIYQGEVVHRRHKPKSHLLKYRVFPLLIDLEELPLLDQQLNWFSHNRFNLFSFHDRDFGTGDGNDLIAYVRGHLKTSGMESVHGPIKVLAYPRVFGYVFNPLTTYYCYRTNGDLGAVLYEVSNTFGQRHTYVIKVPGTDDEVTFHETPKQFYVSPFISMEASYRFRVEEPGDKICLMINLSDAEGRILDAHFTGVRKKLCDAELLKLFITHPLMTFKVIGGIHCEALLLWLKRTPLVPRPDPPLKPLTITKNTETA